MPIKNITDDGLVLDGDALIRAALARALSERFTVDPQQVLPDSMQLILQRLSRIEVSDSSSEGQSSDQLAQTIFSLSG